MDYRSIMSGQRCDPLAFFFRFVLWCAQWPYQSYMAIRNRRFDRQPQLIHHAGVPVISVGNLTTGGTGKTPMVCYLAQQLRKRDVRVAIVSRGYGAEAGEENDEALELAVRLPDVPHVQDRDRVAAAQIATEELESQLILMDDGFQHRRLARDFDIVLLDATNPFGFGHCLPRGLLREPKTSLQRAHAVILSRGDLIGEEQRYRLRAEVARIAPDALWCEAIHQPSALLRWPDRVEPLSRIAGQTVALVSAIGNPQAFEQTMLRCGAQVVGSLALPDHDSYDLQTMEKIQAWLTSLAKPNLQVICTHKDLVKLQTDQIGLFPVAALMIELRLVEGEQKLMEAIEPLLNQIPEFDSESNDWGSANVDADLDRHPS